MKKPVFILLLCILILPAAYLHFHTQPPAALLPVASAPAHRVLLLPLDSRPPCRKFVQDAGRIADTEIVTPPPEILDYYTQPGDTRALREWIAQNITGCDAAILSIDQLLYGGLLAAREAGRSPEEIQDMLDFLLQLHEDHPEIPLYAFNILPRMQPPASIDGYEERRDLVKYSRLLDEFATFDSSLDYNQLRKLEKSIPAASREKYLELFARNTALNEKLSHMAHNGTLARLIIGQDDSEDFGIPNMEKRQIRRYLTSQDIPEEQVCITHGADEAALTLLAEIKSRQQAFAPRIYIDYNDPATPSLIMPYMAVSTAATATEKIRMLHGSVVETPDEADFILFLSCGTDKSVSSRAASVQRIQGYIASGKKVALVDLSKHFSAEETLFPQLLREQFPLHGLIAYAGWNTTSNAIGTALAQAILFTGTLDTAVSKEDALTAYRQNLVFLDNRFLEDYYYLKDVITLIDTRLKRAGFHNVYDLDIEHNYRWANAMLQQAMKKRLETLKHTAAFRAPFTASTPEGPVELQVRDISLDTSFPWPRTFEIYLQSTLWIYARTPQ